MKIQKKYLWYLLVLIILTFLIYSINKLNKYHITKIKSKNINIYNNKCYLPLFNYKIIHLIITRFLIEYHNNKKLYFSEKYIKNGIKVMKKYLLSSLENQSCKSFTWILMVGDKVNITYLGNLLNFNNSFESKVVYLKNIRNYVRNKTKGFDVLITTRIDYDDIIYYDAVNDVRKAINIQKPFLLYGYNRGITYLESDGKYYNFYPHTYKDSGCMSIFISLITFLNSVNGTYIIYDIGSHTKIRKRVLKNFKSYGIKNLNYEPAIFDNGDPKFIWIRQKYSWSYKPTRKSGKGMHLNNLNLSQFLINGNHF